MMYEKFKDIIDINKVFNSQQLNEYKNYIKTIQQAENKNETEKFNDIINEYEKVINTYEENKILINLILKTDAKIANKKCKTLLKMKASAIRNEYLQKNNIIRQKFTNIVEFKRENKRNKDDYVAKLKILRSTGVSLKDYKNHRKKDLSEDYSEIDKKIEQRYRDNKTRISQAYSTIFIYTNCIKKFGFDNEELLIDFKVKKCELNIKKCIVRKAAFKEFLLGDAYPRLTTLVDNMIKDAEEFVGELGHNRDYKHLMKIFYSTNNKTFE